MTNDKHDKHGDDKHDKHDKHDMRYDLEFAPTPQLIDEVLRRFDVAAFVGARLNTATQKATHTPLPAPPAGAPPDEQAILCFESRGGRLPVMGLLGLASSSLGFEFMSIAEDATDDVL